MADIICKIAEVYKPSAEWKNFWEIMYQLYQSNKLEQQESALYIITEVATDNGDAIRDEYDKLLMMFTDAMNENQPIQLRIQALKASSAVISTMYEDDIEYANKYSSLLPLVVQTTQYCIQNDSIESKNCFSSIGVMLENVPMMFDSSIVPLTEVILSISANTSIEWNVRLSALNIIEIAVKHKPTWFVKSKLVHTLMDVCSTIGCEVDPEDMDEWGNTPFRYSCILLDYIARFIPPKHTYNYFIHLLQEFSSSTDPYRKRMAIGLLASMADGCSIQLKDDIEKIVPFIQICSNDSHVEIKLNSCILIGKLSEYLSPEILEYHHTLIPLIISSLQANNDRITESACYSLDALVDNLSKEDIAPYADQLFDLLLKIINSNNNVDIQEMVLIGLGSLCSAAEDLMSPYYETIMNLLYNIVALNDTERLILRARAIDVAGQVAKIVGKETFSSHYDYFMNAAIENFNLPKTYINSSGEKVSNELRGCTLNFFASVAISLGQDFDHYLETAMKFIMEVLESNPNNIQIDYINELLEEENEYDDDDNLAQHTVGLSDIDEKVTALMSLSHIADAVASSIVPYIEKCIPLINVASVSIFPSAKRASMTPLESFVLAVHKTYPPQKEGWMPGLDPQEYPINSATQEFIDIILDTVFNRLEVEFDLTVTVRYLETLSYFAKNIGAPGVHKHLEPIIKVIIESLEEKTVAQVEAIEEEDNEEAVHDQNEFIEAACGVIKELSFQYKQGFLPYFSQYILNPMLNLINTKNPDKDNWKIFFYETLDTVIQEVGSENFNQECIQLFLDLGFKGIQSEIQSVRSNAVYLLGLCAKNEHSLQMYENILEAIMYIMTSENGEKCLDTSCGALGNAILTAPDLIPYDHVLEPFFSRLPIKVDYSECYPTYEAIILLLQKENQSIVPFIPRIIHIFTEQIEIEELSDELKKKMGETLSFLWKKYKNDLQSTIQELSPQQKKNFEYCLSLSY